MDVPALVPNDPRVEHKFLSVGNFTYHYLLAKPEGERKDVVILIHGWPDLGMGWRYQVPYLVSLGFEVIVPDMLGYGQTSAPESPEEYSVKNVISHVAAIIRSRSDQPVILGGHDWGAAIVWATAKYYPKLVKAAFAFCVPYYPPPPQIISHEKLVELYPLLRYQLTNRDGAVEAAIGDSKEKLKAFINGMFEGLTPEGEPIFEPECGIRADRLPRIGQSPLLDEAIIDFYVQEHSRHGLSYPCNWYRNQERNSIDELAFAKDHPTFKFNIPAMIVMAGNDRFLPPSLADGMENYFTAGLKKEVLDSAHFTLFEKPQESNRCIKEFLESVLGEELQLRA
ncbi:alpha/beta-hydrolase [Hypoxylon trugodes]|uniref:alpha/beta-hydrolase n=1 Tax=Hypoxylon trugodes TaxID=326681 RepID=UPI0021994CC8|nr:alpha/beta-hydrolase [Hypoxylon trugodes]KAI1384280.1 alpha/beta-hydrolase [Hypoxylon trugodes]